MSLNTDQQRSYDALVTVHGASITRPHPWVAFRFDITRELRG
jgi:hypothetical protein